MNYNKNLIRCVSFGFILVLNILNTEGSQLSVDNDIASQVLIQIHRENVCQGALIAKRYVLTAAQCLCNSRYKTVHMVVSLAEALHSNPTRVEITDVFCHRQYDKENDVNDIAMLKLKKEMSAPSLNLPDFIKYSEPSNFTNCFVSTCLKPKVGVVKNLHHTDVNIWPVRKCFDTFKRANAHQIMCTTKINEDSCESLPGAPLICDNDVLGILAINHFKDKLDIYTRIPRYRKFITDVLNENK